MPTKVSDLFPAPKRVPWGDKYLEVRGLSFDEVMTLLHDFRGDFLNMMVLMRHGASGIMQLAVNSPKMVTMILGMATDSIEDEEQMRHVRRIPLGVQVMAIPDIWEQTVVDQKKIQELLSGLLAQLKKVLPQLGAKVSEEISSESPPKTEP